MTVYFDLDRVLADFGPQAKKYKVLKKNNRINWIKVFLLGSHFWSTMALVPNTNLYIKKILSYCDQNNIQVKILSSVRLASGRRGKIKWCKNKLNFTKKNIIIVKSPEEKAKYADKNALLIDDSNENIHNFILKGGHGFKFKAWNDETYNSIIKKIKDISEGLTIDN